VEGSDDPEMELADKETILPAVKPRDRLECQALEPKGHTTQSPSRFSEAALTRALEEMGIGRPSTYATIIDTIQDRNYVFKKGNSLVPTWVAFSVVRLLTEHLSDLVDYRFTAQMEDFLDAISRHERPHVEYLREFFFGNDRPGLKEQVATKIKDVDARSVSRFQIGRSGETAGAAEVYVRVGRYGPFLEHGQRRVSLPDGLAPDELTLDRALELLEHGQQSEKPLGTCPATNKLVYLKKGRFGPYVQAGENDDPQKRNASLLKGMEPGAVDLEAALKLLALPRGVGEHPQSGETVVASNGRYGPYIKCGAETRSLPEGVSPHDVSLDQALALLAQPKSGGRRRAAPAEPVRLFDPSPVTGEPIKLLIGRYGPYVTDGATNASVPKDVPPDELAFDQAVRLLADRAASGTGRVRARGRGRTKTAAPQDAATRPAKRGTGKTSGAAKRTSGRKPAGGKGATG